MNKDNIDKKETLMEILKEDDKDKLQEFLLRNGKKKTYSPLYIKKDNIVDS